MLPPNPTPSAGAPLFPEALPPSGREVALVTLLLIGGYVLLLASQWRKSVAYDEIVQSTAGYSYWKTGDFRIDLGNGNLPKLVFGAPLAWSDLHSPSTTGEAWHTGNEWKLADEWFHESDNDVGALLHRGRAAAALFAVALGLLIWHWSRRLFGPAGGLLSLTLFVLDPSMLAHGALMTSDTATALGFAAATLALWRLLHRVTVTRVVTSCLAAGALVVCKASAALLVPIAVVLVIVRLARPEPLPCGRAAPVRSRAARLAVFAGLGVVHVVVGAAVVWACYGFRYSMFAPAYAEGSRPPFTWEYLLGKTPPRDVVRELALTPEQLARARQAPDLAPVFGRRWSHAARDAMTALRRDVLTEPQAGQLTCLLAGELPGRLLAFVRVHRLLPEAFIASTANGWWLSRSRVAFLNGAISPLGWPSYFPYTFLVKTPLPVFGIGILALAAVVRRRPRGESRRSPDGWSLGYATIPLWALLAVYWLAAIGSHLNIGHRHLLPVYPPLFILGGAAAAWLRPPRRAGALTLALLLGWLVLGTAMRYPDYLSAGNELLPARRAFRHVVDSTIDWGQELPAVRRYLTEHPPDTRAYFAYFGTGSPDYYRIAATPLYPQPNYPLRSPPTRTLTVPGPATRAEIDARLRTWPDYEPVAAREVAGQHQIVLVKTASALQLRAGTYLISATLLQPLVGETWGPWNATFEREYQALRSWAAPLLVDDPEVRAAALNRQGPAELWIQMRRFEEYRFARLTAFLRQREPDALIAGSVLVYQLTEADLGRALDGPPAELGPNLPAQFAEPD